MAAYSVNYDPSTPTQYHGFAGVFLTVCFFQLLNLAVIRAGPPKRLKGQFFRWKNLLISWTHALIVGIWDLLSFWLYPEMTEDLIEYNNWFTYSLVVFSTGYFIYDFLDIAWAGELFSSWEIIGHHIAVLSIFIYDVVTCKYTAYTLVALLTEVNSIFLHSRKLMQLNQCDYSGWPYRSICMLNLLTFVPFRFGPIYAIFYAVIFWKDRMSVTFHTLVTVCTSLMLLIYCVLFWRLVKSDVLRPWLKPSKKHQPATNNNTENLHLNSGTSENNHSNNSTSHKQKTN